jgi:hypothetical protein
MPVVAQALPDRFKTTTLSDTAKILKVLKAQSGAKFVEAQLGMKRLETKLRKINDNKNPNVCFEREFSE